MWRPRSEQDILSAVDTGDLIETATFDAKSFPPKHVDEEGSQGCTHPPLIHPSAWKGNSANFGRLRVRLGGLFTSDVY